MGLTATVAKDLAGALNYTPVAKVTNLGATIEETKARGMWFVCADMDGELMYQLNLTGPIGLVIGSEGEGVGRLVKEKCDLTASIPMKGGNRLPERIGSCGNSRMRSSDNGWGRR